MKIFKDHAAEVTVCYPLCDCCDNVVLSFYTTDIDKAIDFSGAFLNIDGKQATVHFTRMQIQELEDGVLRYVVKHNGKEIFMESTYYVKTPVNYQPSECHDDDELIEANEEGFAEGYATAKETITNQFKEVTITENGVYEKEGDFDAFKKVTVDVKSGEAKLIELNASPKKEYDDEGILHYSNREYSPSMGIDGYSKVIVRGDDIEFESNQNMQKASAKAKAEGYNEGYEAGDADGYERGTEAGYQDGYSDGVGVGKEEQKAEDDAKITPSIKINSNGKYTADYGYKEVAVGIGIDDEFLHQMGLNGGGGNFTNAIRITEPYESITMPTRSPFVCDTTPIQISSNYIKFDTYDRILYGHHIAFSSKANIDNSTEESFGEDEAVWYIYKPLVLPNSNNYKCRLEHIYLLTDDDDMFADKAKFDSFFNYQYARTYKFTVKNDAELNYLPTYMEERMESEYGKIIIERM